MVADSSTKLATTAFVQSVKSVASGVTAATYSHPSIVIDASGRITSAASLSAVSTFNTRSGGVTLSSSDVTTALGYTPVPPASGTDGSVYVNGGIIYIWAAGGWKQVYPAIYQA